MCNKSGKKLYQTPSIQCVSINADVLMTSGEKVFDMDWYQGEGF